MKKQNLSIAIIVAITATVVVVALSLIVSRVHSVTSAEKKYDQVSTEAVEDSYRAIAVQTEDPEVVEEIDPRAGWLEDEDGKSAYTMKVDAEKLLEINEDYIGWIYGCGGDVDYPICESEDDQFYLKHGFDKSKNIYGTLFTEQLDNGFLYTDVVVYGHHMKNGTMFNKICNYKEEEYFTKHPYFYVFTTRGDAQYEIFSAYYIDMDVLADIQIRDADLSREAYIQSLKDRSLYDTGVEVSENDNILTLVTCEYTTENGRMILHLRKVKE